MNFLSAENLSKAYGDKMLFQNLNFGIEKGQKVALVAKNGAGKTTLLRILMGEEVPDEGEVAISKEVSIGFLSQAPQFEKGSNALSYIFQSKNPIFTAIRVYEETLENQTQNPTEENLTALQEATQQMDNLKAWDYEVKIKQILTELKITNIHQTVDELSGGQKKRIALARVLIENPDLLVLDEPTNHLDLDMIEWLEEFLSRQNLSLLLVTHDRYFLDRICNNILELEDGNLYRHQGNYSFYLEKKAEREQVETQGVEKARNLMRKELEWMRRMPKARGTKAKYRIDAFHDLKTKAHSGKQEAQLDLGNIKMARLGGKILEVKELKKAYGDLKILDGFTYTFKRKERIGIVGKNGVGKSTFLNMLTEQEKPDSGEIDKGETVVYGYYTQAGLKLDNDKRVIDVVQEIAEVIPLGNGRNLTPSQFLATFQFPHKQQYEYVSTLSGGEKRRLYLLTILVKNPNFLILDEPTNDLDLVTLNRLEEFLDDFPGCVIVVTHDRYFMDKIVDHLFVFEGKGQVKDFNGKYIEYRDMMKAKEREEKLEIKAQKEDKKVEKSQEKKRKLSYKEKKEYEALESEIEQLEAEKEALNTKMSSGTCSHEELQQLSEKVGELMEEIDEKTMRWMELDELA